MDIQRHFQQVLRQVQLENPAFASQEKNFQVLMTQTQKKPIHQSSGLRPETINHNHASFLIVFLKTGYHFDNPFQAAYSGFYHEHQKKIILR